MHFRVGLCFLASPPLASLKWAVEKGCLPVTAPRCKGGKHCTQSALVMCNCSSTGSQPYGSSLLAKLSKRPSPAKPPIPASVLMQAGELLLDNRVFALQQLHALDELCTTGATVAAQLVTECLCYDVSCRPVTSSLLHVGQSRPASILSKFESPAAAPGSSKAAGSGKAARGGDTAFKSPLVGGVPAAVAKQSGGGRKQSAGQHDSTPKQRPGAGMHLRVHST